MKLAVSGMGRLLNKKKEKEKNTNGAKPISKPTHSPTHKSASPHIKNTHEKKENMTLQQQRRLLSVCVCVYTYVHV